MNYRRAGVGAGDALGDDCFDRVRDAGLKRAATMAPFNAASIQTLCITRLPCLSARTAFVLEDCITHAGPDQRRLV